MIKKSDIVKEAVRDGDWKKALQTAKDFRIGVTQEERSVMARAYECIVHPDFYKQIGIDIAQAVEQGKTVVKEYAESRRKNSMKWDVKHDKAKRVIDAFLDGAEAWHKTGEFTVPKRENLTGQLSEEEKAIVSEELALMIASIRKRYKLQERLPEQEAEPVAAEMAAGKDKPEEEKAEAAEADQEPTKGLSEQSTEAPAEPEKAEEKPKRGRRSPASGTEKKPAAKRGRKKKAEQEESAEAEQATA